MKKQYETPTAEKIRFNYREQVVATSGDSQTQGLVAGFSRMGATFRT